MMVLNGLKNFLNFVNNNWVTIAVIVLLTFAIIKKAISFFQKSDEEKIEIVKKQIKQSILRLVTEAEIDYQEWISAGEIKRSQVIDQIYEKYPILSKVADQEDLIKWIDKMIDDALDIMREVFKENSDEADNLGLIGTENE